MTITDKIAPIHPGEVLLEDFIEGFGITQNKVAVAIGVPPRRINEIVHGKRGITADTAARLARYFGTTPQFWLNLQTAYELDMVEDLKGEQVAAIQPRNSQYRPAISRGARASRRNNTHRRRRSFTTNSAQ